MLVTLAFGIGYQEIIVVLVIVVLLFGATKIPQLGASIGQGIKNFKRGMREVKEEEEEAQRKLEQKKIEDKSEETTSEDEKK